jgi:hypothetical protein
MNFFVHGRILPPPLKTGSAMIALIHYRRFYDCTTCFISVCCDEFKNAKNEGFVFFRTIRLPFTSLREHHP